MIGWNSSRIADEPEVIVFVKGTPTLITKSKLQAVNESRFGGTEPAFGDYAFDFGKIITSVDELRLQGFSSGPVPVALVLSTVVLNLRMAGGRFSKPISRQPESLAFRATSFP